ncbi:hypothetical protein [Paucibacter sp. Y2R2-4]|uniref:hypothetical protein n=1 Tax=Paucibacter sp. Y2R2-4 TaxID=2893553 RepID=UPI0021E3602C|nr:hypothetical protein [Paucibacter sp. Y2R2-4]MCV2351228.1 hypothetical protein [Paucibacter sp. Y2R2-4]
MNRLQQELQRLYGARGDFRLGPRAALLGLAKPAEWRALGAVWRGVQADLGLPAPAIAVSGQDGFQLWFALAEDDLAPQAAELMRALCRVYLPALKPAEQAARLCLWPRSSQGAGEVPALPPQLAAAGQWSAFVAPDLAPVFSEEPWLDTEPGPDAQADVLARLACISRAQLSAALLQLNGVASAAPLLPKSEPRAEAQCLPPVESVFEQDPRAFLLRVMNDAQQPMALRIEAAKALLPGAGPGK